MTSVVSGGTTDRIVARTRFSVLRAGSGTAARYSSTLCGALPLPIELVAFLISPFRLLLPLSEQLHFACLAARRGARQRGHDQGDWIPNGARRPVPCSTSSPRPEC